jgi:hypothetical protein
MARARPSAATHPSPARGEVSLGALLYGLIAGPAAWGTSQVLSAGVAARACFPTTDPLPTPAFAGVTVIQGLALLLALAIAASGGLIAAQAWRRSRDEHRGGHQTLLDIGEGRSRFLAFAGLLTSGGFGLAILFSAPAILLVRPC